jgi:hypothetical protein
MLLLFDEELELLAEKVVSAYELELYDMDRFCFISNMPPMLTATKRLCCFFSLDP